MENGNKCERCGCLFQPKKRQNARFCSVKCRVAAHRGTHEKLTSVPALVSLPPASDPATDVTFNARQTLREIAADARQPAAARVAACKALLADAPKPAAEIDDLDPVTRRAIELLNAPSSRLN